MSRYAKLAAAVVATALSALVAAMTDGAVTNTEWINVAILAVGAGSVFAAPNVPGARYTKSALAVLSAVLVLLASFITDGLTPAELLQLAVAGLGAVGVYAVPNANAPGLPVGDQP